MYCFSYMNLLKCNLILMESSTLNCDEVWNENDKKRKTATHWNDGICIYI